VRRMIHGLRPSLLDDLGLVPAVRWYAQQSLSGSKTQAEIDASGINCRLPDEVETILFRIAQEGLNNVAHHARASHVRVCLTCNGTFTQLAIEDDGVGFDPALARNPDANQPGWGLAGIQERVNLAGGQFSISSSPGKGTLLQVTVPTNLASDR
jgi:two-component system, NarL family, sensor histidine kinase UhpB